MATHSSVLAWRIPGTGEPGGLPSMGSHRVSHPDGNMNLNACPPITETKGVPQRLLWDYFYTIPGIGWSAQNTRLVNKTQSLGTWFIKQTMYIPWKSEWQPTPVFLPGESHRQRSLAGYSPQCYKELDTTEFLTSAHTKD